MTPLKRWLVWLSRIHLCQGFGIQSPADFAFVRTVVNEHSPYYAYDKLQSHDWLQRKLGRLYLRIANWRQPTTILTDDYQAWFLAGCRSARIISELGDESLQLALVKVEQYPLFEQQFYAHSQQQSVVIIEGISRDWPTWHHIERDSHTGTTFDLYYCGVVLFNTQRYKHNYRINF